MLGEACSTEGRRAALLAGGSSLGLDIVITTIEVFTGELEEGRGPILDIWDLVKVLVVASALVYAAWRVHSRGLVLFASIFTLIGIADYSFGLDDVAAWLVGRIDLSGFGDILPGDSAVWVETIILTVLASIAAILIWAVTDTWEGYRSVRRWLTAFLAVLIVFAVGVDLLAALSPFTELATLVEETGERFTLSVTLGYVTGLASDVRRAPPVRS